MVPFGKADGIGSDAAVFRGLCIDLLGDGLEEANEHMRIPGPADVCLEVVVVPFLALRDE